MSDNAGAPNLSSAGTGKEGLLQIRRLDTANAARWDAFVTACPDATFFHRAGWKGIIDDIFGHPAFFLYAESDGRIRSVLPLVQVKSRLFGHSLVSLPFCSYGGVAAIDAEAAQVLEREAIEIAESLDVDHLEVRNLVQRHADWPVQNLYSTFRKPIIQELDESMRVIPVKRRNMVRKGMKLGLANTIETPLDVFFDLYAKNVHQHGTPALPKRYFAKICEVFGRDCEILTVLDPQKRPVSTIMTFYFRDEAMAYYAGESPAARDLAANDYKYWALLMRAKERGSRIFDFGRGKQGTGSYEFKKLWGFDPQPLYYEYRLFRSREVPQNNPMNPKYRAMIALWKRLPISVCNWLGPYLVRSLG
ncbi:MAG: FemAB family PEP-CTERM system-associated protein [Candidatus Competibacter sp.]|nr:FemAB family PEP-CTERM system-associated protein [Candidatus Competibacter sp.]MDG4605342.1 FemAB family PEP-CTERM system-associated protein [Candidatus Contendobacter sp.]HRD48146.1 FemAB family PEP-CTERM system-associated protein [Candidatus Contendobacter sp.]